MDKRDPVHFDAPLLQAGDASVPAVANRASRRLLRAHADSILRMPSDPSADSQQHLVSGLRAKMTVIAMGLGYAMSVADPTILSANMSQVRIGLGISAGTASFIASLAVQAKLIELAFRRVDEVGERRRTMLGGWTTPVADESRSVNLMVLGQQGNHILPDGPERVAGCSNTRGGFSRATATV